MTDDQTNWADCKHPFTGKHKCHPYYFQKYDGYCLDCENAGVSEAVERLAQAEETIRVMLIDSDNEKESRKRHTKAAVERIQRLQAQLEMQKNIIRNYREQVADILEDRNEIQHQTSDVHTPPVESDPSHADRD